MSTLTELREEKGFYRVEEFALFANIAASTIRKAENGVEISLNTAYRFADALGIARQDVFTIEGLKIKKRARRK